MVKLLLFDFSKVLLFPADPTYQKGLNDLYNQIKNNSDFAFENHFRLDSEFLEFIHQLPQSIDRKIYTSEYIQDDPAIAPKLAVVFSEIYSAATLGLSKKSTQDYQKLAEILHTEPESILFIDDTVANIQAADEAGYQTIHFQSASDAMQMIQQKISS